MKVKPKILFDKEKNLNDGFSTLLDCAKKARESDINKYLIEFYQYDSITSKPFKNITDNFKLIEKLEWRYIFNHQHGRKPEERKYPSLCCISKIMKFENYNFNKVWEKIF